MDKEKIDISVIVPVYGVEKYVERCVRSLMEQTMTNDIEFIFVDDCTHDKSVEIIERTVGEYPQRISQVRVLHHKINKGSPATRNTGLNVARGEYIYYCDSDDRLRPEMLRKLHDKAVRENLDFVWCDFYFDNGRTLEICKTAGCYPDHTKQLKNYIASGWNVVWNTICRREIYLSNNICSNPDLSFCEDYELMIRLMACAKRFGKVDLPLYYYNRENATSIISQSITKDKIQKTIKSEIDACKSVYSFFEEKGIFDQFYQELSWRNLKAKRGLVYPVFRHKEFLSLWPDAINYIDSLPFCSKVDLLSLKLASNKILWPLVYVVNGIRKIAERLR